MKHMQEVVIKNSLQCLECEKILESHSRHDYRVCGCPNSAMVDGGHDYIRWGAMDMKKVKDLSVVEMQPVGCSLDHNGKCWRCEMDARQKEREDKCPTHGSSEIST